MEDSLKIYKNLIFTGGDSITPEHLSILLGLNKKIDNSIKLSCVKNITKGGAALDTKIQLTCGSKQIQTTFKINVIWNKKIFFDTFDGFSQKIDDNHFWIGTYSEGLYQVKVDNEGKIFSVIPHPKGKSLNQIPSVRNGFCQKIDDTHYLIGTFKDGLYEVELDKVTKLINKTVHIKKGTKSKQIPDVHSGFCQKIDDTHYLIGTYSNGLYQVIINKKTKLIETVISVSMEEAKIQIPNTSRGFCQKIDNTHYLIGTVSRDLSSYNKY